MTSNNNALEAAAAAKQLESALYNADTLGKEGLNISDQLELIYQFIFDPKSDFREINKLWSLTNLTKEDNMLLQRTSANIRILDKQNFYQKHHERVVIGYNESVDSDGIKTIIPVFEDRIIWRSRFENIITKYRGRIDSATAGAGGVGGALVRAFRTAIQKQDQTVEDRTDTKRSIWAGRKK